MPATVDLPDIEPENLLLLSGGSIGLIDFGIARQFKDGKDTDTRHIGTCATAVTEQYGYAQTDQQQGGASAHSIDRPLPLNFAVISDSESLVESVTSLADAGESNYSHVKANALNRKLERRQTCVNKSAFCHPDAMG